MRATMMRSAAGTFLIVWRQCECSTKNQKASHDSSHHRGTGPSRGFQWSTVGRLLIAWLCLREAM